ncbi:MAG: serine/threonine protein kinase [Chitinispirillaceae bacterium]|nr:serine/threonine protein kinase [Chitinispirillaceae bacterium]
MDGDTEYLVPRKGSSKAVVMPDGKSPLPLGSGSIEGLIGTGGMSNVYKIWNPQMEMYRAVKLMKPDLSDESRQRFQTEIKITAALSHPNIIEIHSVGEWNSLAYIEMEYIDGITLSDCIARTGALPLDVCTALGIMTARALDHAHSHKYVLYGRTYHGVIHRDLKTSNIMIAANGRVKLMDFGIARPVETSLLTMDGAVMGTMQYLAPEQIDGKNVGVAADLYSLGVILYEVITGRKAFPQKNLSQLMSAKTANIFIPIRFFKIKIPRRLKQLVMKCMQRDPRARPQSAQALLQELESIHRAIHTETPEKTLERFQGWTVGEKTVYAYRKRLPRRALAAAAGVCLLVAGAGSIALFAPEKKTPQAGAAEQIGSTKPAGSIPAATSEVTAADSAQLSEKPAVTSVPASKLSKKVVAQEKKPRPPKSYTDRMRETTGIDDPLEIMTREAFAGKHESVLRLYGELPADAAGTANARILRLRALSALDRNDELGPIIAGETIDDGEYYLIQARILLGKGRINLALQVLEKAVATPARQLDARIIRREYLYWRAICLGRLFEQTPSDEFRKNALDGWFEVKNSLRSYPDHSYYRRAVHEMQKIGTVALESKG